MNRLLDDLLDTPTPTRLFASLMKATAAFIAVVVAMSLCHDADSATRSADAERENHAAGMAMMEATR